MKVVLRLVKSVVGPAGALQISRMLKDAGGIPAHGNQRSAWVGEAGPGPSYLDPGSGGPLNDFTNRNVTFKPGVKTQTARYLQQRLNWGAGPLGIDGDIGPQTVRALQRYVTVPQDGQWGPQTTVSLQRRLNSGTLT